MNATPTMRALCSTLLLAAAAAAAHAQLAPNAPSAAPPQSAGTPGSAAAATGTSATPGTVVPQVSLPTAALPAAQPAGAATSASAATASLSLSDALTQAGRANSSYAQAVADAGTAQAQVGIQRAALLPGIVYHNQFLYTQGQPGFSASQSSTGAATSSVRYIANNTIHEYISQGVVTETIGGVGISAYRKSVADAAVAKARLEVARRGLVSAVIGSYYAAISADAKVLIAQRALDEAARFGGNTTSRLQAGEVARADVVKSDLQQQQRQRDLNDAQLTDEKARIDLAVLLYPDPLQPYTLSADLNTLPPLPDRAAVEAAAARQNPDLRAAMEALRASNIDLTGARFAYFPDLTVQYFYGIDAPQFAVSTLNADGVTTRNLGYSASATLDIPVWDWLATHQRIKQAKIRQTQAQTELTITQRQLVASLKELFDEATISQQQLVLLDKSIDTAAESLRLTNLRYGGGEGSVLEVVDAQNSLVAAQQARVDGAVAYVTALANLQTLTGTMP